MNRLLHLVDESATDDAARLVSLLMRQPLGGAEQMLAVIGHAPPGLGTPTTVRPLHVGRRFSFPLASVLDVKRVVERWRPDVVHALDPFSSAAVGVLRAVLPDLVPALVTTVCDPADASRVARWSRAMGNRDGGRFVCGTEWGRRRLVEAGVPPEAATVIRTGVDFGEILAAGRAMSRAGLGLPATGRVLLTPAQPSRAGGQFYAVWATAILNQIWPDVRLIVPGTSREAQRLRRLGSQINCPGAYVFTGDRYGPAELLAVADMLIAPALSDVPTGWLAWAMAAGVPVTGSAIPCVTEFIADRHTGFLCRQGEPHTLATRIRLAFADEQVFRRCIETARGQAYEAFRAVQCGEAYLAGFHEAAAAPGRSAPSAGKGAGMSTSGTEEGLKPAPCSTAGPG